MKRLKIYNNTIISVDQYGINVGDRGRSGKRLETLEILNNLIVDCGSYAGKGAISVSMKDPDSNPKINHNLVISFRQKTPATISRARPGRRRR